MNVKAYMAEVGRQARKASRAIAAATTGDKNQALLATAEALDSNRQALIAANAEDLQQDGIMVFDAALLDRLELTPARIDGMIEGCVRWRLCRIPVVKSPT